MFARFFEKTPIPVSTNNFYDAILIIDAFLNKYPGKIPYDIEKFLYHIKNTLADISEFTSHNHLLISSPITEEPYKEEYEYVAKSSSKIKELIKEEVIFYSNNPISHGEIQGSYIQLLNQITQCCDSMESQLGITSALLPTVIHKLDTIKMFCELFHGTYKPFSQMLHPLLGSVGGLCAGIVENWAQEENRPDNQYFKIGENTFNLHVKHPTRFNYMFDSHTHINRMNRITDDIKPDKIYRLRICDSETGISHAMGVRRINNNQGIELIDPNLGLFSFLNAENFKAWLPFMISIYYSGNSLATQSIIPRLFFLAPIGTQNNNNAVITNTTEIKLSDAEILLRFKTLINIFNKIVTNETLHRILDKPVIYYFEIQSMFEKCFASLINMINNTDLLGIIKQEMKNFKDFNIFSLNEKAKQDLYNKREKFIAQAYSKREIGSLEYCNQLIEDRIYAIQHPDLDNDFMSNVKKYFSF